MPSNAQIDETLSYVLANSPLDLDKLSPDGRRLIQDSREIIETAQTIVREKNADELFQNFVWNTRDVELDRAKKDPSELAPVDKDKAVADSKQGKSNQLHCAINDPVIQPFSICALCSRSFLPTLRLASSSPTSP